MKSNTALLICCISPTHSYVSSNTYSIADILQRYMIDVKKLLKQNLLKYTKSLEIEGRTERKINSVKRLKKRGQ